MQRPQEVGFVQILAKPSQDNVVNLSTRKAKPVLRVRVIIMGTAFSGLPREPATVGELEGTGKQK